MAMYAMASGRYADQARREKPESDLMFDPPPDLDSDLEGDSGKAECSWERTPEGKICITAVNGVSVGPNADRESKKPDDEASEGESESGDKMGDETGE